MRDADQRRARVEHPADRVEVVLGAVACLRLHEHQRPVGRQRLAKVSRRPGRVAEVVEGVEQADEVVPLDRQCTGSRDLEAHPLGDPALLRRLACALDPTPVRVKARERRGGEGLGHDDRRGAVAAADVRHARPRLELLRHAVERGKPARHQVLPVPGTKERLRSGEQAVIVLAPRQAAAAPECFGQAILIREERREDVVRAQQVELALLVRERDRLLRRDGVSPGRIVVAHVTAGGLIAEPLADHPGLGPGSLGELSRRGGTALREGAIETEPRASRTSGALHAAARSTTACPMNASSRGPSIAVAAIGHLLNVG